MYNVVHNYDDVQQVSNGIDSSCTADSSYWETEWLPTAANNVATGTSWKQKDGPSNDAIHKAKQ